MVSRKLQLDDAPRRDETPYLQIHLEPSEPIEIKELIGTLKAVSHQYQIYAAESGLVSGASSDARLLIASVSHGSIDINLLPDMAMAAGLIFFPLIDKMDLLVRFGSHLKDFFGRFSGDRDKLKSVSIKDCEDAANIASPIAQHGGRKPLILSRRYN